MPGPRDAPDAGRGPGAAADGLRAAPGPGLAGLSQVERMMTHYGMVLGRVTAAALAAAVSNPVLGKRWSRDHPIDFSATLTLPDADFRYREAPSLQWRKWTLTGRMQVLLSLVRAVFIDLSESLQTKMSPDSMSLGVYSLRAYADIGGPKPGTAASVGPATLPVSIILVPGRSWASLKGNTTDMQPAMHWDLSCLAAPAGVSDLEKTPATAACPGDSRQLDSDDSRWEARRGFSRRDARAAQEKTRADSVSPPAGLPFKREWSTTGRLGVW